MSRLQLLILWVLALVAGLIVFSFKGKNRESLSSETNLKQGDTVVSTSDLRSYGGLNYANDENETTLINKAESWLVAEKDDYPVNLVTLGSAFDTVRDLKIVQGLPAEPKHWDRFGLNPDAEDAADRPRQLNLLAKDGTVSKTIFIGKERESTGGQNTSGGRFVRFSDDDSGVYIVQQAFTGLNADPESWIDKKLPKIEGILSIATKPKNELFEPWTVTRKTAIAEFELEGLKDGHETNPTAVAPLKNFLIASSFTSLLSAEEVEKRAEPKDAREITIKTASGISYLFTIVPEKKDAPVDDKEDDKKEKTDERNYIISFKLLTGPSDPAKPADDASEADKAGYQALFANKRVSEARYQEHKVYEGRQFLVSNFVVNALLKNRYKMHKSKAAPKPAAVSNPVTIPGATIPGATRPNSTPPGPGIPTGNPTKDNANVRKRIEAVTPPIAIPQMPKKEAPKPADLPKVEIEKALKDALEKKEPVEEPVGE
tara:strand:- start:4101 stop:5561 length:1461 start_codon:yes stop_codon:yes gene_type:complete